MTCLLCPSYFILSINFQIKYGRLDGFGSTVPSVFLLDRSRSGYEDHWHWETVAPHQEVSTL